MIRVGVIHCWIRYNKKSPLKIEKYNIPYQHFSKYAKSMGMLVFLGRVKDYDKKRGILKNAMFFDSEWQIKRNVKIDILFKRTPFDPGKAVPAVNNPAFSGIANNKSWVYRTFKNITPRSFVVNSSREMKRLLPKIRTKKIVFKPVRGSDGIGIKITEKPPKIIGKGNIMQEFVESKDMPKWGIKKRAWDLRVTVIDGKIIDSYIRIAKRGCLLSNVYQGGKMRFIRNKEIPRHVRDRVKLIDSKFRKFGHRIYSADFIIDPENRPWLIEINTAPGIYYPDREKERVFYTAILKTIKAVYLESLKR